MNALDKKLFRDLFHLRGQALAIILIVACGITGLVAMMSAYDSLQFSQATYYQRYRFAQIFAQLERAPNSLVERIEEIPGVRYAQTRVVEDVNLDIPGLDEPATGRLVSIPELRSPILNDLHLRQGRYIQPGRPSEVLVNEAFALANGLELGDTLGAVINQRWENLEIVGIVLSPEYIYAIRDAEVLPDNEHFGVIWMGRNALDVAFDLDGAFNDVTLSLMAGASEAEVIFRLDQLLERYGGLGAYGRDNQISNHFISEEIVGLAATAVLAPSIFLGIAAFLLNLLLARLISTQRDQIAVLKAFGYDNLTIGLHYLKLVLMITFVGAGIGVAFGHWLGLVIIQFYTDIYHFPVLRYEVGMELITTAIVVSIGAAALGALTAVRRAISLPPAEAMRPDSPAHYHPTLIERVGLQRFFPPSERIILRNLERRLIQSVLSVLGIALAVAILVIGRYFEDAANYLVDVQFRHIQREDVTLVFNQPRPSRARYELQHLPGVLQSEPFRAVAARLRFEHRTHLGNITGLEATGRLRRLLDKKLQVVDLPPNGVVLSAKLAEILGVSVDDGLTVEVLEGERPTRTVPVAGLVDDLVGLSAYMDIHALNRLMREGQTLSGAYLTIDSNYTDQLYKQLKQTPAVAIVALRQATINQFQQTIVAAQEIFNTALIAFACIITFGLVYNSAQIALSERSRELATLRIIGFTKTEIAFILLGEQAILTLIAIPIGFVVGFGLAAFASQAFNLELYRLPLIVTQANYAFAFFVTVIASFFSGWIIHRLLNHLDLIAVLKTRE